MTTMQHHRIIRKLVVGFGNLFKDINLVRYNEDMTESERFIVPIAYASKENYVSRLQGDPNLNKKVQTTLPRMSFEMTGMRYDSTRKQNTNIKNVVKNNVGIVSQYNPVPYNFDFDLNLYIRNIEDGNQIIEYILPFFTPDYTIKLNVIPEMGIVKEIPVILNNIDMPVDFEGDRERESRIIIWNLKFTVKGFVFGKISNSGIITHTITSIYKMTTQDDIVEFDMDPLTGSGQYQVGDIVYQGFTHNNSTATAKVVSWSNFKLHLNNIKGNFISTEPINGSNYTNYRFTSYTVNPQKYVRVDTYANTAPMVKTDQNVFTVDNPNLTIDNRNKPSSSVVYTVDNPTIIES